MLDKNMPVAEIESWLRERNDSRLAELWSAADAARKRGVGDTVHLRGLIEISNHCSRRCAYCGLHAGNKSLERYRMNAEEILACAHDAARFGYGTVVMQSGEDDGIETAWLTDVICRIKAETALAVTLGMGERPDADLSAWKSSGADRYLMRFETSDENLYAKIHPPRRGRKSDRIALLRRLRQMGYEIGGGVMVGIPGQSYASLTCDIVLFRALDLDMIGVGPYIPHPQTSLGSGKLSIAAPQGGQVPNDELTALKVVALARVVRPDANIPATTALAVLNPKKARTGGLARGANVVMPNLTPLAYRLKYEIYPHKALFTETAEAVNQNLQRQIASLSRVIGSGHGSRGRTGLG